MYGDAATKQNDFAFDYLPKIDRNYSWTQIWDHMYRGNVKGLFAFGMNGVMIGPDTQKNIDALKKAEWLVVGEIYPDETSEFWRAPGITADEMKNIKTTVYRLPCAGFAEKDGRMANSARWLQWKNTALPPPGEARLDQDILAQIFLRVRDLYKKEGGKFPDPIFNADVGLHRSAASVALRSREGNQRQGAGGSDGPSDAAGNQERASSCRDSPGLRMTEPRHAATGSTADRGRRRAQLARRGTEDPSGLGIYPNWAWSWPVNRRVLYNRASCDLDGKPWDSERRQVWWNEAAQKWVGNDVPDFKPDSHPKDHMGPFIMNPEGVGRLFVPLGALADGPFPEHYEPFESPIANPLHPNQSNNPVVKKLTTAADKFGTPADGFTVVCTTYRLTEQYHYWTKNNPMNVQLIPEPFIEIPVELADDMGVRGSRKDQSHKRPRHVRREGFCHAADQTDDDRR